ncbi:MAG: hypothetical protein LBO77_03140 [Desulfovibrio sp.]|jgi:hypothetical protein|nr:hypothetical protein [Desulfovibrio sp.]
MKQCGFSCLILALFLCAWAAGPSPASAAEPGRAIFCKGITENWEPIEPAEIFETNVISTLFKSARPFGNMKMILSIYLESAQGQELLHRESGDVNPAWNVLYLGDIPLPAVGTYSFVLSSPAGEDFSSGRVTIKEKTVEKPIPEKNEVEGTTLEGLFKKFKEQTKPKS